MKYFEVLEHWTKSGVGARQHIQSPFVAMHKMRTELLNTRLSMPWPNQKLNQLSSGFLLCKVIYHILRSQPAGLSLFSLLFSSLLKYTLCAELLLSSTHVCNYTSLYNCISYIYRIYAREQSKNIAGFVLPPE